MGNAHAAAVECRHTVWPDFNCSRAAATKRRRNQRKQRQNGQRKRQRAPAAEPRREARMNGCNSNRDETEHGNLQTA
ncbi:hypothetical protein [Paraburkholderia sp. SUR17]|uniref:hypothetical protein n=1 Tax=Paraburkholderia sp. SUR17 TaxID=3034358 RepID=UPI002407A3C7|nr:hypothetical protein [Paraburkholderia sp. SUR17]WEY37888.1 hypothetical protein P2869_12520 [Paraburkholderia sp. SUR17]